MGGLPRALAFLGIPLVLATTGAAPADAAGCPERPACHGCGCKGGPGYRGPDGQCVGYRDLERVCGDPPTSRCVFENAPGTGLNKECATRGPRSTKRRSDRYELELPE
jgi:hypothetical protein